MPSRSFSDALELRYGDDIENSLKAEPYEIFVVGSFPGRSSPDGKLMLPKTLTLNCCDINRAGSLRNIEDLCQDVEELDLAQNELIDLSETDDIIRFMPNLKFLNLSHNDMSAIKPEKLTKSETLQSLVLNHTRITWDVIACFLDAMPNLQELHVSLNNYSALNLPFDQQYPNMKQIFLCGNPLAMWDDVVRLDKIFPCLQSLVIADTHISQVPDPSMWKETFHDLQSLNLNNALLKDWTDVERLNCFPKLDDLRIQGIPLFEGMNDLERRQHLISYLPLVTRLNGSVIGHKEREDAERAFIRHYLSCNNNKPKRVDELEKIHGKLGPLLDIDLTPQNTAAVVVHFCEEQTTITVNLQQSVQDLKEAFSLKFGIRPAKMRLYFMNQDQKVFGGPEELKFNSRKLYSYRIQDGDEFIVDTK